MNYLLMGGDFDMGEIGTEPAPWQRRWDAQEMRQQEIAEIWIDGLHAAGLMGESIADDQSYDDVEIGEVMSALDVRFEQDILEMIPDGSWYVEADTEEAEYNPRTAEVLEEYGYYSED